MQAKMLKLVPSHTTDDSINHRNPFGKQFSNIHREAKKCLNPLTQKSCFWEFPFRK